MKNIFSEVLTKVCAHIASDGLPLLLLLEELSAAVVVAAGLGGARLQLRHLAPKVLARRHKIQDFSS